MKINIVKPLLLCAASSLLIACGGGSGGSDSSSSQSGLEDTADPFIPVNQANTSTVDITEDNYVASASTFYNTALITASGIPVIEKLNLSRIQINDQASTTRACDFSGEITTETVKNPLDERIVHSGDSLKTIYSDCKDASYTQTGTQKTEVNRLEGTYASGEYVIYTNSSEDITRQKSTNALDNGVYRHNLSIVHGLKNNETISLTGINLGQLDANIAPSINFPDAVATEVEYAKANELASNPSYYSTPAANFKTFAFELITEDAVTSNAKKKIRWKFDITNKEDANASYSTKTTRQLILEDRYVEKAEEEYWGNGEYEASWDDEEYWDDEDYWDDEEDGDTLKTFALSGKFHFKMATGEIIYVEIFSPDANATLGTQTSSNVVVSFDNYGDGVIDHQTGLTWEEFNVAMLTFGFSAP